MMPPRMRISGENELVQALLEHGHVLVEASEAELIFDPTQLVRRGQIVAHLGHATLADLDAYSSGHAFVLTELMPQVYAVTASDELAGMVAELLIGELGGRVVHVPESQRDRLTAGLAYAGFIGQVRSEARNLLTEALGNAHHADEVVEQLTDAVAPPLNVAALERGYHAIDSVGTKRLYAQLARRSGEVFHNNDVELWAMNQEQNNT